MHYYGVADRRITILEQLYIVKHETFSDIPYNFIDIFFIRQIPVSICYM